MSIEMMISIQPPFTGEIFGDLKDVEWRTQALPTGRYYCYETKNGGGCGKVIGEFTICHVKRYNTVADIPSNVVLIGCVARDLLQQYSKGRPLYAHLITNKLRYDKPLELSEFMVEKCQTYDCPPLVTMSRPPQSWCYVVRIKDAHAPVEPEWKQAMMRTFLGGAR